MKARLLISILIIVLGYFSTAAQFEHSFVDEGNSWEIKIQWQFGGNTYDTYELDYKKDTIIGADTISILSLNDGYGALQTFEVDKQVFMMRPNIDSAFFLLYDWNLTVGDTFKTCYLDLFQSAGGNKEEYCTELVLSSIDSVLLFDSTSYRKRMNFETIQSPGCVFPLGGGWNNTWIDGIGDTGHPFPPNVYCFEEGYSSYCYSYEGEKLYFNCGLSSTEDEIRATSVRIVPNPVPSIFRVDSESAIEFAELIDRTGKPSKIPAPYDQDLRIPSHFSAGIYYLRVVLKNGESKVLPLYYVK